jgi:hypothetical protein
LSPEFFENAAKQRQWTGFLRPVARAGSSVELRLVAERLALFLMPPAIVAATGGTPPGLWDPDLGWHEAHGASGLLCGRSPRRRPAPIPVTHRNSDRADWDKAIGGIFGVCGKHALKVPPMAAYIRTPRHGPVNPTSPRDADRLKARPRDCGTNPRDSMPPCGLKRTLQLGVDQIRATVARVSSGSTSDRNRRRATPVPISQTAQRM